MNEDVELQIRRLRWQCRRGMLELDFLLERYLDQGYASASATERDAFRDLLSLQDPMLNEWLVTGSAEPDAGFRTLVRRIRTLR
jgi:antitoxin CptB